MKKNIKKELIKEGKRRSRNNVKGKDLRTRIKKDKKKYNRKNKDNGKNI